MIKFILNDQVVATNEPPGKRTLDFLRDNHNLKGTKEGCREGDCGACTILIGERKNNCIKYRPVTSCLLPLAKVNGKHVVTIEGLNKQNLNQIQQFILDERASQCGFCTPGIILSLTGFFLNAKELSLEESLKALDGNVCRCTGYSSIKRVTELIQNKFSGIKDQLINAEDKFSTLVEWEILPEYFNNIISLMEQVIVEKPVPVFSSDFITVAGGTDLYVQHVDDIEDKNLFFISNNLESKGIYLQDGYCCISALATVGEIYNSELLGDIIPEIKRKFHLISSTPIRNMATLGGNIVNASPIGDLSVFLLALNSEIVLVKNAMERIISLKDFFVDYKKLNKKNDELVDSIRFKIPDENSKINFEKISKRTVLDIASVNSAMQISISKRIIESINISAGGIAPVPKYFNGAADFLVGKEISIENIKRTTEICVEDSSPIDDVRGSASYKSNLLRRLIYAHFINLCGDIISAEDLL